MPFAVSTIENNKARICVKGYQKHTDRSWQVIDTYTTGTGFVSSTFELPYHGEQDWCVSAGYNKHDLGSLVSTDFNYTGDFTVQEKELIEWSWEQFRRIDILTVTMEYADLGWEISYPKLIVSAPFHIERVKQQIDLTYPAVSV